MEMHKVIIYKGEDGYFIAESIELPGCVSQGKTRDEAIQNIKEAISGYIETLRSHKKDIRQVELQEVAIEA